jgi:hypothetical protein
VLCLQSNTCNLTSLHEYWTKIQTFIGITTNAIEQCPSAAKSSPASQEIPNTLCNPKIYYRVHKNTTWVRVLSRANPVYIWISSSYIRLGLPPPPNKKSYTHFSCHRCYKHCNCSIQDISIQGTPFVAWIELQFGCVPSNIGPCSRYSVRVVTHFIRSMERVTDSFNAYVVCLEACPQSLTKPLLRTLRSSVSSCTLRHLLSFWRSSSSCYRLPPRLFFPPIFPLITCFRSFYNKTNEMHYFTN